MTKPTKQKEEWIPCPPGKLAAFAGQERTRQRRQFLVRAGSTVGAFALATGAGWLWFRGTRQPTDPVLAGIACSRVRELAPQFMMGKLDEALSQQIKQHLELCVDCRTLLESMTPKMSQVSPHSRTQEHCQCSTCRRDGLVELLATAGSPLTTPTV